jgi:hypothetical protein
MVESGRKKDTGPYWPEISDHCYPGSGARRILDTSSFMNAGIENDVVDPVLIVASRRHRRAKTDRIDDEVLVWALLAYKRGEHMIVHREIGKEKMVRVHYDNGVASYMGPSRAQASARASAKRR